MGPSFGRDVAHTCWEATGPMVVDFPHAWAAWSRDAATGAGERHGHCQNASYALVNSTGFYFYFRVLAN